MSASRVCHTYQRLALQGFFSFSGLWLSTRRMPLIAASVMWVTQQQKHWIFDVHATFICGNKAGQMTQVTSKRWTEREEREGAIAWWALCSKSSHKENPLHLTPSCWTESAACCLFKLLPVHSLFLSPVAFLYCLYHTLSGGIFSGKPRSGNEAQVPFLCTLNDTFPLFLPSSPGFSK